MMARIDPKFAIIGAGPSGLALGAILQKHDISFTIYESDASAHERSQGGTLDLHPATGQRALREAGLWDEFVKHARPEADVMKMVDQFTGEVLFDSNTTDAVEVPEDKKLDNRPEIDREALRDILLAPLMKTGSIQWNMRLAQVVPMTNNKHDLHFKNGTIERDFDLVIGADGAWSKVRSLITDVNPHYSGISALELWINNADIQNPWLSQYVGQGSLFSFSDGRAVQIQRLGDGSIRTYASLRKPESFLDDCGIDFEADHDLARGRYVETYFGDCCPEMKRLLLESNSKLIPRKMYMLPVGHRWTTHLGLTLIGDAAHLMTPFGGVGVNVALTDGLELANAIIAHRQSPQTLSLGEAVGKYEEAMFPRAEKFAQKTYRGLIGHFSAEGNAHMVARLRSREL